MAVGLWRTDFESCWCGWGEEVGFEEEALGALGEELGFWWGEWVWLCRYRCHCEVSAGFAKGVSLVLMGFGMMECDD